MEIARFRGRRRTAAWAALSTLLLFGRAANAKEPEDETSNAEAEAVERDLEKPPVSKAPSPVAVVAPAPAPETSAVVLEHMGPETFPGRLRGIYGGSLWLEPDFQGMQWPQNTRTGLGVSADFWIDSGYEAIKRQS